MIPFIGVLGQGISLHQCVVSFLFFLLSFFFLKEFGWRQTVQTDKAYTNRHGLGNEHLTTERINL